MNADARTEGMVPVAARLVGAVHEWDYGQVARILTDPDTDTVALLVVLAAMVDPDRSVADLLSWLEPHRDLSPAVPDWQAEAHRNRLYLDAAIHKNGRHVTHTPGAVTSPG